MDDVTLEDEGSPDWQPTAEPPLIDPAFDDCDWLPAWLPSHQRDTSLDDWI